MSQRRRRCERGADVPTPYKRWAGMVTDMRGMVNSEQWCRRETVRERKNFFLTCPSEVVLPEPGALVFVDKFHSLSHTHLAHTLPQQVSNKWKFLSGIPLDPDLGLKQ